MEVLSGDKHLTGPTCQLLHDNWAQRTLQIECNGNNVARMLNISLQAEFPPMRSLPILPLLPVHRPNLSFEPQLLRYGKQAGIRALQPGLYACLHGRLAVVCVGVLAAKGQSATLFQESRSLQRPFQGFVEC